MLLCNCNVKTTARVALCKLVEPCAIRHRGCDSANLVVGDSFLQQAFCKNLGVARRIGWGFLLLTRQNVKLRRCMAFVSRSFSGGVALTFFGDHMDQNRPRRASLNSAQNRQKLVHIVPINRTEIRETQLLKQSTTNGHPFEHILGALRPFAERFGEQAHRAFGGSFEVLKRLFRVKTA